MGRAGFLLVTMVQISYYKVAHAAHHGHLGLAPLVPLRHAVSYGTRDHTITNTLFIIAECFHGYLKSIGQNVEVHISLLHRCSTSQLT